MDERKAKIAQAAIRVVSRYGLRKATMSDLADEAGVSRQTIYNIYSNKEEVVRDAIRFSTKQGIEALRDAWKSDHNLGQKLDSFYSIGPLAWFDMIQSSPDAADLIDGLQSAGAEELKDSAQTWKNELEAMLSSHRKTQVAQELSAPAMAEFIYASSHAAKASAENRAHLESQLQTLKTCVLAALKETA